MATKLIGRDVTYLRISNINFHSGPDADHDWMSMTDNWTANGIDVSGVGNMYKDFRSGQISGTITIRARKNGASLVLSDFHTKVGAGATVPFSYTEALGGKTTSGSAIYTGCNDDLGGVDTIQANEITLQVTGTPTIT